MTGPDSSEHRQLRELLGAFVLGGLPEEAGASLRAHLDGCATCRAELAEIAPLADELRHLDPDALSQQPVPPADLGQRIAARIAQERTLVEARARREERSSPAHRAPRRLAPVAAAVMVLALTLAAGTALGRSTAPVRTALPAPSPSAVALPIEQVAVRSLEASIDTEKATIIAHTWGVEARFDGSGFALGRVYRAAFRADDGRLLPAGEFIGTGAKTLKCNMQSALLRDDTTGFVVMDAAGTPVLTADL